MRLAIGFAILFFGCSGTNGSSPDGAESPPLCPPSPPTGACAASGPDLCVYPDRLCYCQPGTQWFCQLGAMDLAIREDGAHQDSSVRNGGDLGSPVDAAAPDLAEPEVDLAAHQDLAIHSPDLAMHHDLGCPPSTADCDHNGSCTPLNTSLNCGSCAAACFPNGGTNLCVATASGHTCKPTCDATHVDCDSNPFNGCEVNTDLDPGEPDNLCSESEIIGPVSEGTTALVHNRRALPGDDVDTYTVTLHKGTHICNPGDPQPLAAFVTLPVASGAVIRADDDPRQCSDTVGSWTLGGDNGFCVAWTGTCGSFFDDQTLSFHVVPSNPSAPSCSAYELSVQFCKAGSTCNTCLQ